MNWALAHLESLQGVLLATFTDDGQLIDANRGFLRLLEAAQAERAAADAAPDAAVSPGALIPFFIQPDFATLSRAPAAADGLIHNGLLTLGQYMGRTQTLRGQVWRHGHELKLLAEFDIEAMESLCATTLELNHDYARAQLDLAQSNLRLKQSEARLQQLVHELTAANAGRQLAQDQLLLSEKQASIGFLAAGVAHEINNPLGYLTSNLHTVSDYMTALLRIIAAYEHAAGTQAGSQFAPVFKLQQELDLAFIRDDIGPLLTESRTGLARVKQIVQALQDFSGMDAAKTAEEADIGRGVASTLDLLATQLSHCEVRNELAALPPVQCGVTDLSQVLMNLLLNAAQAIETRGVVTIRGGHDEREAWVEIADTGKGMDPHSLLHIFDPFYTTKPLGQGTGLGLSVSHGLVSRHRGRIEVQSEPGNGACFKVFLPLRQAEAARPNKPA